MNTAALRRVAHTCAPLVLFSRRASDPAIHRVIGATREEAQRAEFPHEETTKAVAKKLKDSPLLRALALRAGKAGVGAGLGGYLGYKAHRRRGIIPGAKAGAIAGLFFELPISMNTLTKLSSRVSLTDAQLARLLGAPVELATRLRRSGTIPSKPLYREDRGPAVYTLGDIVAAREAVELSAGGKPIELAAYVLRADEEKRSGLGKTAATVAGAAALAGGASYLRGRLALGKRAGGLSLGATAVLGLRRFRQDGAKIAAKAGTLLRK